MWTLALFALFTGLFADAQASDSCVSPSCSVASDLAMAAEATAEAKEADKGDAYHAAKDVKDPLSYGNGNGDNDGDGVRNRSDAFPNDPRNTKDSDGDGVGDTADAFPNDAKETKDSDCDGVGDNADDEFDGMGCVSHARRWSGDGVYGQNIAFDMVTTEEGKMHVTIRVNLSGSRDKRREAIWEHWSEMMWTNDEMVVDVIWTDENPHKTVKVYRGSGRANSGTYYTASSKWVVAHEIGHLLGLHDEYYDRSDPNRLMGEGDALMAYNFDGAKTYPRYHKQIMEHFDTDKSRPAALADLPKDQQKHWVAPEAELVACPAGTTKYESVKADYKDLFCKKDGEKTYMAYTRGSWWEWSDHHDDGSATLTHPSTRERLLVKAGDLVPVAPPGTNVEPAPKPRRVTPPPEPQLVACPEGTSKYKSVKEAYEELFCQKDGEKTYLANIDGEWWTWDEHLDDGSVLLTNDDGDYRVFTPDDLTPTAPTGTVIEDPVVEEPAVADPEPVVEDSEDPAVTEEEIEEIEWDPVVEVEEDPAVEETEEPVVTEPEPVVEETDDGVAEVEPDPVEETETGEDEEVTSVEEEAVWPRPRPRPGPPPWLRDGEPPPPWLRGRRGRPRPGWQASGP